jgi:hypothetical protein
MERVLDLTLKLADEGLSAEELGELERLIEAEPLARRRHLEMLEVEAALRSAGHGRAPDQLASTPSSSLVVERRVAAVLQRIRRPALLSWRPGRRARTTGIAAVSLAAAAALVLVLRPSAHHRAEGTPGAMARMNTRPAARQELATPVHRWSPGAFPVRAAGPADRFTIDLADSGIVEVRGRAVLGVERAVPTGGDGIASRVTLDDGTIAFQRGNGAQAAISTRQGEILVRSGRAVVIASADSTRVDLLEGEATIAGRDGVTRLGAHQAATVTAERTTVASLPSAVYVASGGCRSCRSTTAPCPSSARDPSCSPTWA